MRNSKMRKAILKISDKVAPILCRVLGHKSDGVYELEYPSMYGPPEGRLYCVRCGELFDERC